MGVHRSPLKWAQAHHILWFLFPGLSGTKRRGGLLGPRRLRWCDCRVPISPVSRSSPRSFAPHNKVPAASFRTSPSSHPLSPTLFYPCSQRDLCQKKSGIPLLAPNPPKGSPLPQMETVEGHCSQQPNPKNLGATINNTKNVTNVGERG